MLIYPGVHRLFSSFSRFGGVGGEFAHHSVAEKKSGMIVKLLQFTWQKEKQKQLRRAVQITGKEAH